MTYLHSYIRYLVLMHDNLSHYVDCTAINKIVFHLSFRTVCIDIITLMIDNIICRYIELFNP